MLKTVENILVFLSDSNVISTLMLEASVLLSEY